MSCYLAVVIFIAACDQSHNRAAAGASDTLRRSAGTSDALNNLKRSEHYENVERINAKIIRKSKEKFSHKAKNGSDTVVVSSKTSPGDGAYLSLQFEVVQQQAINLDLKLLHIGKNCLFPVKYRLLADHQVFDLTPGHLNRSNRSNCIDSASIENPPQALMEAVAHASSVIIEFDQIKSVVKRKVATESIHECREAYEYYLALGGKF